MNSKFLSINLKDVGHSIYLAAETAAVGVLLPIFSAGSIPTAVEFITSANAAIVAAEFAFAGGVAGILKALVTNSDGTLMKKEG